jgi:hypothetical protein
MTFEQELRTWILRSPQKGEIKITLDAEVVLTVTLSPPSGPGRSDTRKLKDYGGALTYVKQFILEREVRGFRVAFDSDLEARKLEAAAKAKAKAEADAAAPPVNPRLARVVAAGTVVRDGWVAISCERHIADDVIDAIVTDKVDTVQLICDGGDGDNDGDADAGDDRGVALSARTLRQVLRIPRPNLRMVVLDTHWQTLVRQVDDDYGNRWGDLGAHLNNQPQLERVYAAGVFGIQTPLRSEKLRDLTVICGSLHSTLKGLQASELPALSHLGVAGSLEVPIDVNDAKLLFSLLRGTSLPALTHLDVDGVLDPVSVLEAAAGRGLSAVSVAGELGEEDDVLPRLLALAPAYKNAKVFMALDTLSEDAIEGLQAQWPGLTDYDNHDLFLPDRYTDAS